MNSHLSGVHLSGRTYASHSEPASGSRTLSAPLYALAGVQSQSLIVNV